MRHQWRHGNDELNFWRCFSLVDVFVRARGKHEGGRTKIPTEKHAPMQIRRRCHLLRGYRLCHVHLSIGSSNLIFLTPAQMQSQKRYDARMLPSLRHAKRSHRAVLANERDMRPRLCFQLTTSSHRPKLLVSFGVVGRRSAFAVSSFLQTK